MIEFFNLSWGAHIFITFILGICVLAQTLALVLNFLRHRLSKIIVFENLFEIAILSEILVFSLLYGQMVNAYKNGFVVVAGYENVRIIIFISILIFAIAVSILRESLLLLSFIPVTLISLPIMENITGRAFPWFFIGSLIFFLIRSIKICISNIIAIKNNISALSVIHAMDTLHTGVLFSENNGHTLLSNYQMQNLMILITGKIFRNSKEFYDILLSDQYESRYEKLHLDGQAVYLLPDKTAWMFTKTDIPFRMKNYMHISAADVSENWALTLKLQLQDKELRKKSAELKNTISNLHILSKEKEIENAKMRAHDILGQRLTVILRMIQNEDKLDYDLLTLLSRGLLDELKAEDNEKTSFEELKSIQQIFTSIGVEINFKGKLPDDEKQACLFVDIIREGSTNAVRHGLATQVNIESEETEDSYNLVIANIGHTTTDPITPGSGLKVIRKKVHDQGGNLEITSHPQFTLSVVLPGGGRSG